MKHYRHVRTEKKIDSEGEPYDLHIHQDEDGKEYQCWKNFYMIPKDFELRPDTPMRMVNYSFTYDPKTKSHT